MPNRSSKTKGRDVNVTTFNIVQAATENAPKPDVPEKNPAAVALGRLGGLVGGKARAKKMTAKKRSEIAKKAAAKRWGHAG